MKNITNFILESKEDLEDMTIDLSTWWDEHVSDDGYDNHQDFMNDMKAMADEANDPLVDAAFDYLLSKGWKQHEIDHYEKQLIDVLVGWASDQLSY